MFQPFICGTFDPRTKSRKNSFRKSKGLERDDKNPYSDGGLDKFSALLAELEEKKQKIYSQGMPLVRFTYKNSTDIVPIVIRLKDDKEAAKKKGADTNTNTNASKDHHPVMKVVDSESEGKKQVIKKISSGLQSFTNRNKKKRFSWNLEPSYYVPAILLLILLLLVFFDTIYLYCMVFGSCNARLCEKIEPQQNQSCSRQVLSDSGNLII